MAITISGIARVCHEANRALCASIGDQSQVAWDEAPEWQKTSSRNHVTFTLENPDAPASTSHETWLAEKQATGWRYGPVKDEEAKTHPSMVPYDELPAEERAKDHLLRGIVLALAPFVTAEADSGKG